MKQWKHLTIEHRKIISSGIAKGYKLNFIAESLNYDPTSISKEVKRNRVKFTQGLNNSNCQKVNRWPYVCSSCKNRYQNCLYTKYKYDAGTAQRKAEFNLINSRKGIDLDSEEFATLDETIKSGIEDKKSIYQIKVQNNHIINNSVTTLYRYVNNGYLTTKRLDLPYAVRYKKRKRNKKYEYTGNNYIDRNNHTYLDYLSYLYQHPGIYVWQLDFLGAVKTDNNNILSLILPNLQFPILDILLKPDSNKVVDFFDKIEERIGTETFMKIFPVILTDRDPCFSNIQGICFSKITGEERCKIFYCDPYTSSQKPNVENINKQLRLYFPKGKSIDRFSRKDIQVINQALINRPLRSLDSYTPKEAFSKIFEEELINKLLK